MKLDIFEPNKIPLLVCDPKNHKIRVLRQLVPSTSSLFFLYPKEGKQEQTGKKNCMNMEVIIFQR
jgi:hypothetical protein